MLLTIERIHNSPEKQLTENRNLSVVINGKGPRVISAWTGFPTA